MSYNEYWDEATERAYWDYCAEQEAEMQIEQVGDNDLIRRGNAKRELYREWCESHEAGVVDYQCALDRVPAVPQEMSAVEYEKALDRMEDSWDSFELKKLWNEAVRHGRIEEAVAIVSEWAHEHPEER